MFKSKLLKNYLGSLCLSMTLVLPLVNAEELPISSPRTAPLLEEKYRVKQDQSDIDISVYLQDNCKDNKERAIIYIPKTGKIEDISLAGTEETVIFFNKDDIDKRLKEHKNIIYAHSHFLSHLSIYDNDKEHKKALDKYGEYRIRRRMMTEIPTSRDFETLLNVLYNTQSKAIRDSNNTPLNLDCRIVVLEPGVEPRVISYGVKTELLEKIKDYDHTCDYGLNGSHMKNLKIRRELDLYQYMLNQDEKYHSYDFEITDKPDPCFPELALKINENTNFFILDRGYVKTGQK
jgi:hypothetical protein